MDRLETLEYSEMIKLAAVYKILEDEGVTPELLENGDTIIKENAG